MSARTAIIDTNVVVSGLLTKQPLAATAITLDGMMRGTFRFVLSAELLKEYRVVLLRPAIMKLHKRPEKEIDEILTEIVANGIIRKPTERRHGIRDPKDSHVLDLALEVTGAVVVTGDDDSLSLRLPNVTIVTPRAFVDA